MPLSIVLYSPILLSRKRETEIRPTRASINKMLSEVLTKSAVPYKIDELLTKLPSISHPLLLADLDNPLVAVKGNSTFIRFMFNRNLTYYLLYVYKKCLLSGTIQS
jgi:hypothetical protein